MPRASAGDRHKGAEALRLERGTRIERMLQCRHGLSSGAALSVSPVLPEMRSSRPAENAISPSVLDHASNFARIPSLPMIAKTENVCLKGAEYINVDLAEARFHDVNLSGSRFEDVSFAGVIFTDISLSGAAISDANCSGMTIENACYDRMTIDGILVTELLRVYGESSGNEAGP